MHITVRLDGDLRRYAREGKLELDMPADTTVTDVIQALGLRGGEVWLTTLGSRLVTREHRLQPGDELSLIPSVGGGE